MVGDGDQRAGLTGGVQLRALLSELSRHGGTLEGLLAAAGLLAFLAGTLPDLARNYDGLLTWICVFIALAFAIPYAIRLWQAPRTLARAGWDGSKHAAAPRGSAAARLRWALTGGAMVDLLAAAPVPLALLLGASNGTARLFGVFWSLKLIRFNPAFVLLARVLRNERQSLISVTMAFVVVLFFAATAAFLFERTRQPESFGSIPAALWWAVTTITTTGYGDKVPASFAGRILAGAVMVCGIGLFALWAGILASGFSQELRRSEFLRSWELVVRLPLFRNLGAPAISEIARLLKVQNCGAGIAVVRQGEAADSMYFIADGEVEVRTRSALIRLAPGQFFGEMALLKGEPRNATVIAIKPSRLLRLDVVDFRGLAARQPELLRIIEAEGARRDTVAGDDAHIAGR